MAATSAPNHDGVMLLEAPFARVPHEELRRYLRMQQRLVERDLTYCSTSLDTLSKSARSSSSSHLQSSSTPFPATTSLGTETPKVQNSSGTSGTISRASEEEAATAGESSITDNSLLAEVSFTSDARADDSFLAAMAADTEGAASTIEGLDISSLAKKSGSELERSLDQMIGRIKGLKRKLGSVHESAGSTLSRLDARTGHLNDLQQIQSTSSPAFDEWCRTRLDRMLVDWMLRKGFTQSATMLANNRHIENYVDLNLFTEIARIEGSLIGTSSASASDAEGQEHALKGIRSCTATLAWCSENKAALRKIRSSLEFDLRLQEFIELTRDRSSQSLQEAINYSRKYLLPYLTPTAAPLKTELNADATPKVKTEEKEEREEQEQQDWIRNQVARVMGLLACGPSGWAYTDLYDVSRWNALQQKFRSAALQIHSLPPQPLLHIALSAGLSSLKLPACYTDDPSRAGAVSAHLGGRAFGDERSNLLSVTGVTSTSISAPPIFPPAAGYTQELSAPPSVVLSPPPPSNNLTSALSSMTGQKNGETNGTHSPLLNCKNDNCPVCDSRGLGVLAKEVPWSHHINSTLVCAINGRIMNENDPPMALPNGRVYSLTALQEMAIASQDGQTIVCPRTMASFKLNDLRKVYIS
ncbi:hypothetical protein L7F22_003033 [Adiantum nelumboides]|nr:hypothetical protein [Adiantum nelumboides]